MCKHFYYNLQQKFNSLPNSFLGKVRGYPGIHEIYNLPFLKRAFNIDEEYYFNSIFPQPTGYY